MNKLLTIVIPVYNTELWKLERCLKSIPNHEDIFVYIYDDCSDRYNAETEVKKIIDNNKDLEHLYKDGNKFIRFKSNKGLGFVRNTSIDNLYGNSRYVLFLDSDDEISIPLDIIPYIRRMGKKAYFYGIDLITDEGRSNTEYYNKYIDQMMIPYFITPCIYDVEFLFSNSIRFDESRRTFEDIMFSVKLWSNLLLISDSYFSYNVDNEVSIYKYHLEGESLTRNNKLQKMIDDLEYWVSWIKCYYRSINGYVNKGMIKPYLINRIKYESVKILSLKMKLNGDLDRYNDLLFNLKPYNVDKIL